MLRAQIFDAHAMRARYALMTRANLLSRKMMPARGARVRKRAIRHHPQNDSPP